jgi:hypothetical protein
MMARCGLRPNGYTYHKNYTERGITVCNEWATDKYAFYVWAQEHGWVKGVFLDRKDNDLGYSPSNCRFVTAAVSARNRRTTRLSEQIVRDIKFNKSRGYSVAIIARTMGIPYASVYDVVTGRTWKEIQ